MNLVATALKFRNRPLTMLMGGQGVVALANLLYGKATALYISPAEWGQYSILLAAMTLLQGFMVTPTVQSFKAALASASRQVTVNFYGRILLIAYLGICPLVVVGATIYFQNPIWVFVWVAAVGQGIYAFSNEYLNFFGRHRTYSILLSLYALSNLVLFGVIVIGLEQRTAWGLWQLLALVNSLFAGLSVWQSIRLKNGFRFESWALANWFPVNLVQPYRRYIWPLVSLAGWSWLINYADRYLIRFYLTDADVGQYAMGCSVGSKMLILVAPLIAFLSPLVFQLKVDGQPSNGANPLLLNYLRRYIILAGCMCLVFFGTYQWVGRVLLSKTYEPAFIVGPIVATGYLFLTCIHILEIKWYAYGLTRFMLWHNIAGALLNIGLNLALIPRFNIVGAALATLLGFAGQFMIAFWLFLRRGSGI